MFSELDERADKQQEHISRWLLLGSIENSISGAINSDNRRVPAKQNACKKRERVMWCVRLCRLFALFLVVSLIPGLVLNAQKKNTSSAPPPPRPAPAPAARPAPAPAPSRPAGGGAPAINRGPSANAPSAYHPGPSANAPSANHPGPAANGPMMNRPAANGPAINAPSANHPPAANGMAPNRPASPLNVPAGHPGFTPGGPASASPHPAVGAGGSRPLTLGGGRTVSSGLNGGRSPMGSQQHVLKSGSAVQIRPNGRLSDLHDARRGMEIHHGLNGSRAVIVQRPDHSRVFAERGRPGFVERSYRFHDHDFARRTYYYHGRVYDHYYRPYSYHGVMVNVYAPVRYYPIGFYGWAYNPWYRPAVYSWGWGQAPWYGYYGGYFAPYQSYPDASYWLTDYMVANDLQAQYQANQEAQTVSAPVQQGSEPVLTPEVKQMISAEVRSQLTLEYNEAQQNAQNQEPDPNSSGIGRLLSDGKSHVFVAAGPMDLVDSSGTECSLTAGDVLGLNAAPDPAAEAADVVVLSSKGNQECQKSAVVTVQLSDLQDMQNHMRETIDQGLEELQQNAGKNGLPAVPPSAQQQATTVEFARLAPSPDPAGADDISRQLKDADAAEQEVTSETQNDAGILVAPSAKPPVTIAVGQSIDDVKSALGQPTAVIDLGSRKIYRYPDMKVTFKDGKVTDVQ